MFLLFASGKEVTKFNPIPDAWEELSASERTKWLPSADQIAIHTPLVPAARIAPYLREWSLEGLEGKANPHDKFEYTNCWQVIDFMRELGFVYPEPGQGVSYRFKVKRKR